MIHFIGDRDPRFFLLKIRRNHLHEMIVCSCILIEGRVVIQWGLKGYLHSLTCKYWSEVHTVYSFLLKLNKNMFLLSLFTAVRLCRPTFLVAVIYQYLKEKLHKCFCCDIDMDTIPRNSLQKNFICNFMCIISMCVIFMCIIFFFEILKFV